MIQVFKWVSARLYARLNRGRILKAVQSDPRLAWPLIEHVWSQASGVYRTRVGASARKPFELLVLEEMLKRRADYEELFSGNLLHHSSYVSAYCLLGLEQLNSPKIKTLPAKLLERKDCLAIQTGSFVSSQSLGTFAKQISDAASNRVV
jgi:hypothetical protein